MLTEYELLKKPDTDVRSALAAYPELVQDLLFSRGITTREAAEAFLNPDYDAHTHDPFLLRDMDKAVRRIIKAIDAGETVALYSDFDADGIPAGVLLHDLFKKVGHTHVINYIPHRNEEGFGFHKNAVGTLARKGVTLIITVDVGVTDVDAVTHARSLGVDVIITDHHIPNGTLPDAVAVVNPMQKKEKYPFKELCGTGVAYKLAQAVLQKGRSLNKEWVKDVPEGWEKWLLDLVAIATVADMVPLTGENRVFVFYGLKVLRKSRRPGIQALCRKLRLTQSTITEDDIGFSIAPRINAASRMDTPEVAFTLLATQSDEDAVASADTLDRINNQRKAHVASLVRELKKRFHDANEDSPVLVAGNPNWNPALLGLAANSLVDVYHKPVCLWGREGTGVIKGSCRGDGSINIVELFEATDDTLIQYGGHAHAGGFSVKHDAVHTLAEAFKKAHALIQAKDKALFNHRVDALLQTHTLTTALRTLTPLAPFGIGNPKPLFLFSDIEFDAVRTFGKNNAHIEVQIRTNGQTDYIRALSFFASAESFTRTPKVRGRGNMLGTVEHSRFNGMSRVEVRIVDIV
jgi:single-stranded-DNA-specific exonuclease